MKDARKVLISVETLVKENERLEEELYNQEQSIKRNMVQRFNDNILYWVDGYQDILDECGITDKDVRSKLINRIKENQIKFIERVI